MKISKTAQKIAARTEDAYSADRYENWGEVAQRLLTAGYSAKETEAIMTSKITRWAADADATVSDYGQVPACAVTEWLKANPESPKSLRALVAGAGL